MNQFTPELIEKAKAYFLRVHGEAITDDRAYTYLLSLANLWLILARIRAGTIAVWEEDRPARAQRGGRSS